MEKGLMTGATTVEEIRLAKKAGVNILMKGDLKGVWKGLGKTLGGEKLLLSPRVRASVSPREGLGIFRPRTLPSQKHPGEEFYAKIRRW